MSDGGNILGIKDLFEAVVRVETKVDNGLSSLDSKVDQRLNSLDGKVDAVTSRQDRLEGKLEALGSVAKWVGLSGLGLLVIGFLYQAGVLPL